MIKITLSGRQPAYLEIAEQVRLAVAEGRAGPGDRLAPVRALATELGINPSTVAHAYRLLEAEGIVSARGRGGSVVAADADAAGLQAQRAGRLRDLAERATVDALAQGYTPEEIEAAFALQAAMWRDRREGAEVNRETHNPHSEIRNPQSAIHNPARLYHFAGSHDLALEALWMRAARADPPLTFTADYVGSLDGLLALLHGRAGLAGCHLLDEETGEYNVPILRRIFPREHLCVITVADRQQGLIVPPGNPHRLHSVGDLAQPGLRIINRQPGSGTRRLLDYQLRALGISPAHLAGYEDEVTTHLAVAAAVAMGAADAGLGLLAAARSRSLDFIPIASERYDLVLMAADRDQPPLSTLLAIVKEPAYQAVIANLGGYDVSRAGEEARL
jgi:molybdate-binding protein/DNA-binding transcriptional regulator YhcF (GntR family)